MTAKDFRTWHGTVTAAVALASQDRSPSTSGRTKQTRAAIREAAELLGNTPAVARSAYVDPRVIDLFEAGHTLAPLPTTQDAAAPPYDSSPDRKNGRRVE